MCGRKKEKGNTVIEKGYIFKEFKLLKFVLPGERTKTDSINEKFTQ